MLKVHGTCDWCKKQTYVTRYEYIDGKSSYACPACQERALLDIKLYNAEEQESIRQCQRLARAS